MIWANAMWLISILLSLTSAMIATLPQQWARRYVEMPIRRGIPNHCAGARSFLFLDTEIYKILFAIQMAQTPMHLSVYLFFAGLVVVFRTINKSVAIAVEDSVGVFAVAYIALSILPCLDVSHPDVLLVVSNTCHSLLHSGLPSLALETTSCMLYWI